jgi:biofilm PGA synthesis N-glycosyltransferase PgaC
MMQVIFITVAILFSLYGLVLLVPAVISVFSIDSLTEKNNPKTFITVLVPVRNEAKNISDCLESLSRLNYPDEILEIILIDDHSTDETKKIAREFSGKIPHLKIIDNLRDVAGKKSAITLGVNSAKGELIVTTDGDCVFQKNWLLKIAELYERENPVFIAGPVAYKKKNNLFRDLLEIEQVILQLVASGSMKSGFPMLCSGANLAYRKDFFLQSGGYENDKFASGDDMFLMIKAMKRYPGKLKFLADRETIVLTEPATTFREAVSQRSRWVSKFSAYRTPWISGTGILVFLSTVLPLLLGLISLCNPAFLTCFLWALSIKTFVDVLLLSLAVPFYREPRLLLFAITGEIVYPFLTLISTLAGFSGYFSWKGRKWKT